METSIRYIKVDGMACNSCESSIQKLLDNQKGIVNIKADYRKNIIKITHTTDADWKYISNLLDNAGYKVIDANTAPPSKAAHKWNNIFKIVLVIIGFSVLYFIIAHTISFQYLPDISPETGYLGLFVIGFLTSFHCIAMCGGINISQSITNTSSLPAWRSSLLYNTGRVIAYTLIGGAAGVIGSAFTLTNSAKGAFMIAAGIIMAMLGISLSGFISLGNSPLSPVINRIRMRLAKFTKNSPFAVGLLNGFMPCGPLQIMQFYALTTGSFAVGALSMFFFSLGTVPLMFLLGFSISFFSRRLSKLFVRISAILVILLGLIMVERGIAFVPVKLQVPSENAMKTESASQSDSTQFIENDLSFFGYPSFSVKGGVPVKWNLRAKEDVLNGCNQVLIIPQYGIEKKLQPGDNFIEFTPPTSGEINYSCWMGMIHGKISVESAAK